MFGTLLDLYHCHNMYPRANESELVKKGEAPSCSQPRLLNEERNKEISTVRGNRTTYEKEENPFTRITRQDETSSSLSFYFLFINDITYDEKETFSFLYRPSSLS